MKKLKYLVIALAFFLFLMYIPQVTSAFPIVWVQSKTNGFRDNNNNCFDNPASPNPSFVKNMPINFTNPASQNDNIIVIVHADFTLNATSTNCVTIVTPFVQSITDNAGTFYSFLGNFVPNQTAVQNWTFEIWSGTANAGAQQLTINLFSGKLDVGAVIYDFQNIVTIEIARGNLNGETVVSGASPFTVPVNRTNQIFLSYGITPNGGGCDSAFINTPACVYPASNASAGTGGYNENNITVACPVPPQNGCASNVNSNGKPGGGDNDTIPIPSTSLRIVTARINSSRTGSITWYTQTNSPQGTNFFYMALLLSPQEAPLINTAPATSINIDAAILNCNVTDIGLGPTILVSFTWGDNSSNLGNTTPTQTISSSGVVVAQFISFLLSNHTYYFQCHASSTGDPRLVTDGAILNFTTQVNQNLINFINYGWLFGFLFMCILGLMGAYWIKKRRDEH